VPRLRRSGFFLPASPALAGWANLYRAYGAFRNRGTAAAPLNISSGLSLTRWLTVLLLFVLARVFEQGARMREDLEGTV